MMRKLSDELSDSGVNFSMVAEGLNITLTVTACWRQLSMGTQAKTWLFAFKNNEGGKNGAEV
jgi:hypothetical protein